MLDQNIKNQLKEYFKNLKQPIIFRTALDDSKKSQELKAFIDDVVELSDHLSLHSQESLNARKPSVELYAKGEDTGICFSAIPMGHEFNSFVLAVLQAGGHPHKFTEEQVDTISSLSGPLHFTTYISLSCQNCPEVVQALNTMSLINPNISNTMVDGALFQKETEDLRIMAVPSVWLNGSEFAQGRMSVNEILGKLDSSTSKKSIEQINQKDPFDMLIVGGGPAGASAAIYAARKGIRTGIVADRFGGQVQDTIAIENFISVNATEGSKLVANLENHVKEYPVDLILDQKAARLSKNELFEIDLVSGGKLKAKSVLIATGARWREINVPGEKEYKGKGVAYCPHCDGPFFKGKEVAVIGGGNSGVEAAIDLAGIVAKVTLIEFGTELRADAVLQKKLRSLKNVTIITNAQTTEIFGGENGVESISYKDRTSEDIHNIPLAGVFIQIGLVPNTEWLGDFVEKTPFGEIKINPKGATSVQGVFAAGDVTDVPFKQIIIAMGEGAKASLGAFDYLIRN